MDNPAAVGIDGQAHPAPTGIARPRVVEPTAEAGEGDMAIMMRPERADNGMHRQSIAPTMIDMAGMAPAE